MYRALCYLLQVRSQNLTNELKHAFNQLVAAACEAGDSSSAPHLEPLTPLTVHLFRRCLHTLLSSVSVCGSAKVAAFKTLLQYERFWVAMFGVCAEVVIATQWPAQVEPPRLCRHVMWQCAAYDMWHALRCVIPHNGAELLGRRAQRCRADARVLAQVTRHVRARLIAIKSLSNEAK